MNIAVLSLTRDRLDYTKHCFASLREHAGCDYDHWVYDNGSTDGTQAWLKTEEDAGRIKYAWCNAMNVGIYPALNWLLHMVEPFDYDVVVNFDNDCEVLVPGTLNVVGAVALASPGSVIGPVVQGLRNPVAIQRETFIPYRVGVTDRIGGIFMPIPNGFRYPEGGAYAHHDGLVCAQALQNGHTVGQLLDYPVNHYETTDGQHSRYPEYFSRRRAEGIPD